MEENSKNFIKIEGRITTELSNPASSSQHQSSLHVMKSNIMQQYNVPSQRETNSTSLQITKFQPPDLSDEGSIYRCLQGCESSLGFWLVSSTCCSWFHLEISWISYSSLGEFREASVIGEVSRRFHEHPLSKLSRTFVHPRPSHPIEGLISMHHTCLV